MLDFRHIKRFGGGGFRHPLVFCTEFLNQTGPILDVRSPGEFGRGHIPEAVSFPLFTDAERAKVGICYKHQGQQAAIDLGLTLVTPKLSAFRQRAQQLALQGQSEQTLGKLRLHCWRGGLRSQRMAEFLREQGFEVAVLSGGYKAFRRWVRSTLAQPQPICILGGMTGVGKTAVLHALADLGEPVLDLEGLANHRGSSYGNLGLPPQPTTEQFENHIALIWWQLYDRHNLSSATFPENSRHSSASPKVIWEPGRVLSTPGLSLQWGDRPIWIEAESRQVGTCRLPPELFEQMERAPVVELVRSRSERLASLVQLYGKADRSALIQATERIRKRLGGKATQTAIAWIQKGELAKAIDLVLEYYDKTYRYDLERRQVQVFCRDVTGLTPAAVARQLQEMTQ